MGNLILIMGMTPEANWSVYETESGEIIYAQSDADKSALRDKKFSRLIVILPGEYVAIKPHTLGALGARQKLQAAAYAVEDELAASLEETHIALDPHSDRMAIVSKPILQGYLEALQSFGLYPDCAFANFELLGGDEQVVLDGHLLVHSDNGLGYAIETELAPHVLDAGQDLPAEISLPDYLGQVLHTLGEGGKGQGHRPVNLLQNSFQTRRQPGIRATRRILSLAAAVLIAFLVVNIGQGLYTAKKTRQVRTQIEQIYKEVFPGQKIPANPLAALRKAKSRQGRTDRQTFLTLSSILFKGLEDIQGIDLDSLRYDADRGELSVSIRYPDFEAVEKLKKAVSAAGGVFVENGTRQSARGLMGDAVVRLGS